MAMPHPSSLSLQDHSLQDQVTAFVRDKASSYPSLRAVYVSPDGKALRVIGREESPSTYTASAQMTVAVRHALNDYEIETAFATRFGEPQPGWAVAFRSLWSTAI